MFCSHYHETHVTTHCTRLNGNGDRGTTDEKIMQKEDGKLTYDNQQSLS